MDQETQEVASCTFLPLEHHEGTRYVHPIGGDTSPNILQQTKLV
jgi:hypothetical protein